LALGLDAGSDSTAIPDEPTTEEWVDVTQWMVLSRSDSLLVAMVAGAGFALLLNRATSWWEPHADRVTAWLGGRLRRKV